MAQIFRFKTNLKCGGCVAKIKPHLDAEERIIQWSVDLTDPDRLLIVELKDNQMDKIIRILKEAGYTAELKN